ncbi:MAG TPA: ferrochelatase [Alphaproteobacteria bacterium]|jgi:ferrochelatase|nr:ferrochelatase [Alphaproteobacteria bacterium]
MKRTAVVLFNLGGPDRLEAVRPFLFNLFNDPAIFQLPQPFRTLLAYLVAKRRAPLAIEIYRHLGGGSPLLPNTEAQAKALHAALGGDENVRVFIAMRYWHPFTEQTVADVQDWRPDEIVLLPLYPQFSTTTTASSIRAWHQAAKAMKLNAPTRSICCYPEASGFIAAAAELIAPALDQAAAYGKPRLLLSAHGLPESVVKGGDPYQFQCELTARAIVEKLGLPDLDWSICYQSRVGPMKWIGPSTDTEIRRAGQDKAPVVIAPIAFVSEHSETLVEIEIEYRKLAGEVGVPFFRRVDTVATAPSFIETLADLVGKQSAVDDVISGAGERICPGDCSCPMKM